MKPWVLLLPLLLLTLACATTHAQNQNPTPTPTPTPTPPAPAPTGLSFLAGLDNPGNYHQPNAFLRGTWTDPPSAVKETAVEITRRSGYPNRRNGNNGRGQSGDGTLRITDRDTDKIWFFHESDQENVDGWAVYQIWDDAGCDLFNTGFRINQDCKQWYDQIWRDKCREAWANCANLRLLPDLRPGDYELRVFWWAEEVPRRVQIRTNRLTKENCSGSDYHRITVPSPPTPTPRPTATPDPDFCVLSNPDNVRADPGDQLVRLTWETCPTRRQHQVYGRDHTGDDFTVTLGYVDTYTAIGLTNGYGYRFWVRFRADSNDEWSKWSDPVEAIPNAPNPTATPRPTSTLPPTVTPRPCKTPRTIVQ